MDKAATPPLPRVTVVVATREDEQGFRLRTPTGRSLALPRHPDGPIIDVIVQSRNREGLPVVYNRVIESLRDRPSVLVFIHDDIHLCDFYWAEQAIASLAHFQVAGLAGNKRRNAGQPSWIHIAEATWDDPTYLSGAVAHGKGFPPLTRNIYGPSRQEVKLLDGCMLIVHSETLIKHDLRFDERFQFHFYDMDFCRQAEGKGLKMGTWPISVIHESTGEEGFGSDAWQVGYFKYLEKWGGS